MKSANSRLTSLTLAAALFTGALCGALPFPFTQVSMSQAQTSATDQRPRERAITINGSGRITVEPDLASIQTGVVSEAPTAADALARKTTNMNKVLDALKAAGIDAKDLQTSNFNISPRYAQAKDGAAPRISGYQVSNQVHVIVRDLPNLGAVLDKVVTSGANQVNAIRFEVSKADTLKDEARKQAIANARRRAELYATAAGAQLGAVLAIVEQSSSQTPMPRAAAAMKSAGPAPIEAGSQALDVSVLVTWELK